MTGNGNGNGDSNEDDHSGRTPLAVVIERLEDRQRAEATGGDPVYGWKRIPPGQSITLEQLHGGLIAVSQISEAAIEGGIKMAADLRVVLPFLERLSGQLDELTTELRAVQGSLNSYRKDIQALKDDTLDLAEKVRLVPAIKSMLADVLAKLP